jgi:ferrous iron transport protein A
MMPLSMVGEGKTVEVRSVDCGCGLKRRLCDMGLYDKSKVLMVKNDISGPVIINVKDSKLVIGRGQANKIFVEEA